MSSQVNSYLGLCSCNVIFINNFIKCDMMFYRSINMSMHRLGDVIYVHCTYSKTGLPYIVTLLVYKLQIKVEHFISV